MNILPNAQAPAPAVWKAWLLALRPKTLPAAVVPVLVGAACASRAVELSWVTTAVCLTCAVLLQVASNFANDVFDFEKGTDTAERVGPARAVAQGWISPLEMKRATAIALALAAVAGLYLVWLGGWPLLGLGVLALVCAVAYTAGPFPLGYNGLGEVCVFFFFGPVAVCGTAYLNAGRVEAHAWVASLAVGAITTAILVVNNVRDEATDRLTGKRTLAVRWGRSSGVVEYGLLLALAYVSPLVLLASTELTWPVLLPLATAPLGFRLVAQLQQNRGPALNGTLARTAQLLLLFGLLFAVGLCLG